jgi:hypothetical protein
LLVSRWTGSAVTLLLSEAATPVWPLASHQLVVDRFRLFGCLDQFAGVNALPAAKLESFVGFGVGVPVAVAHVLIKHYGNQSVKRFLDLIPPATSAVVGISRHRQSWDEFVVGDTGAARVGVDRPVHHVVLAAGVAAFHDVGTFPIELEECQRRRGRLGVAAGAARHTLAQ